MSAVVFWLCFTVLGVWGQFAFPGTDFLAAGLLLSLQEERWPSSLFWGAGWVLLQEGMGNLAFGTVFLLYTAFVLAYQLGRWALSARSILLVILLGLALAAMRVGLVSIMAGLADTMVVRDKLSAVALTQAALFPFVWGLASTFYQRWVGGRERAYRV